MNNIQIYSILINLFALLILLIYQDLISYNSMHSFNNISILEYNILIYLYSIILIIYLMLIASLVNSDNKIDLSMLISYSLNYS
jgi:hypothetical protein